MLVISASAGFGWLLSGKTYLPLGVNWIGFGPVGVGFFEGKIFWASLITFAVAFAVAFFLLVERQRHHPIVAFVVSSLAVLSGAYTFEYAYLFLNHQALFRYLGGVELWFDLLAGLLVGFALRLMKINKTSISMLGFFALTMTLWYLSGYPQLANKETLVVLYPNYLGIPAYWSLPLSVLGKFFATLGIVTLFRRDAVTWDFGSNLRIGMTGVGQSSVRQTLFWGSMFGAVIALLLYLKILALWSWRDAGFYAYSILVTSYIMVRFGVAGLYKPPPKTDGFTPSVSVVIPVYNEEEEIEHTVRAWLDCDYPAGKYEVIVVDDGSRDRTFELLRKLKNEAPGSPLIIDSLEKNRGKKYAQVRGFGHAKGEIIVVADSDSFPQNHEAIKEIVQAFADPKIGGACGHTDVANTESWLGKMQRLRYWSAFDRYKRSESVTGSVICLSGCFSAVRRVALDRVVDEWLHQSFLGREASYGDDRALTTLLLKYGWNTIYVPSAKAKTIVPETWKKFWNQQMRWEKSYIRETIIGGKFMWKRPLAAVEYYVGAFVTWGGFVVAAYTIWYRPLITHGTFLPWVYLFGLCVVSLLYAINYRKYNNDQLWVFAPLWGVIYASVLIWRFPMAIMEMHKSDWKTR